MTQTRALTPGGKPLGAPEAPEGKSELTRSEFRDYVSFRRYSTPNRTFFFVRSPVSERVLDHAECAMLAAVSDGDIASATPAKSMKLIDRDGRGTARSEASHVS